MFTEGLDQNAINWIKQGSEVPVEPRSPLAENVEFEMGPKSPILLNTSNYMAPHTLPPLKFHSGLLSTRSVASLCLSNSDELSVSNYSDEDGDESVASAPYDDDDLDGCYTEKLDHHFSRFNDVEHMRKLSCLAHGKENDGLRAAPNMGSRQNAPLINRGMSKINLKVELSETVRRFSDMGYTEQFMTPDSCIRPPVSSHPLSMQGTPIRHSKYYDAADLGTPSAPPVNPSEKEGHEPEDEVEQATTLNDIMGVHSGSGLYMPRVGDYCTETEHILSEGKAESWINSELNGRENDTGTVVEEETLPDCTVNSVDTLPCFSISGQNAWQTLVSYDACVRLCLHAWTKGCTDAPEFLRDGCIVLRTAFGLNKFLLHPQGTQAVKCGVSKSEENTCSLKSKKVVGKIRVEVKKLRIIPRRKLKSTYSQRGAFYMQAGTEYVRQVSSIVKSGINSLMNSSLPVTYEDKLSCLFLMKSSIEDAQMDYGSAICLHPGTGDYHDFFPECQGGKLLIEVQDAKQITHGQAVIPFSMIAENPNDKIRWWPIYHDEHECVGKIQLVITSSITNEEDNIKSGLVVETAAYDLLLEAAMCAQHFHSRNLHLHGPWKWLLSEFADYYGVSDSYTKLRYLSYVMNVATPTKDCLELVPHLLMPVMKERSEKTLNRQEKSILLECETQVESLLANVFENYKSLDELSSMGLSDSLTPIPETAAPALAPAVEVFCLLHDILTQDAQTILRKYLQRAGQKRCRRHMVETDELLSTNSDNALTDPVSISTAYLKMKNLCRNISSEILADIRIHNQHLLPSSIDLSNLAAAVYSTELAKRLKGFLAACPPSSPLPHVNELLAATSDFERDLESWNISPIQDGVDCKDLFHHYIIVWVQKMQLGLLDLCKAEKVPWSGIITNHSTSPFVENMYLKIKDALTQYDMVISRWPQYTLPLENATADVERAIIKALEKQYNEILAPLKDSIPKKLGMQVQKLARRQSTTLYVVPNQLGTFLNTIKRILDVLHCRVEDILKSWASCLPVIGEKKSSFGEQMNGITVLLRTKYKNYMQATVSKLYSNMQASRSTQLKKILEETQDSDGEAEVRERMQMLSSQLIDSISNLHEVFTNQIFIALCRGFWDKMGQSVLKFLEGRKENRVWYKGSYYALGILDDTFASQMQRLQGNSLKEKDLEPPRSVVEARSILCRDATNGTDQSTYFYY